MLNKFQGGLKISEIFFHNKAEPLILEHFPALEYSAALIGPGSEVLGFDNEVSTDHDWRPRFFIFLREADFKLKAGKLEELLYQRLPTTFQGYNVQAEKKEDLRSCYVYSTKSFVHRYLGIESLKNISYKDWLTFDEHRLLAITSGKIFRDDTQELKKVKQIFKYYPRNVWLFLLASEWKKIFEEESFVGRTGEVGDENGSRIIAARIVQSLMRLCFLMEQKYIPYSKWFGTGFFHLESGSKLRLVFSNVLNAPTWKYREKALSRAYAMVVEKHNKLQITKSFSTKTHSFHGRPYVVIGGDKVAEEIQNKIRDREIKKLPLIGSVNQFSNSVPFIEMNSLRQKLDSVY